MYVYKRWHLNIRNSSVGVKGWKKKAILWIYDTLEFEGKARVITKDKAWHFIIKQQIW